MANINYQQYSNKYNENNLFEKLKKVAAKTGQKLVYVILLLYYTLQKDNVPLKAKSIIIGALGYLIAPIDGIPDLFPILGYTDDFGALMMALIAVSIYIDNAVREKARVRLENWFGKVSEQDINEVNGKL